MATQRATNIANLRLHPYGRGRGQHAVTLHVDECTFDYLPQAKRDPNRDYLRVRVTCQRQVLVDTHVGSPCVGWRNGEVRDGFSAAIDALDLNEHTSLAHALWIEFDAWLGRQTR